MLFSYMKTSPLMLAEANNGSPFLCRQSRTLKILRGMMNLKNGYDKVSANATSSGSQCYKKSDGSQDARRGSPDVPN